MYVKKEAYIVKDSASKKLKVTILDLANHYKKTRKNSEIIKNSNIKMNRYKYGKDIEQALQISITEPQILHCG